MMRFFCDSYLLIAFITSPADDSEVSSETLFECNSYFFGAFPFVFAPFFAFFFFRSRAFRSGLDNFFVEKRDVDESTDEETADVIGS